MRFQDEQDPKLLDYVDKMLITQTWIVGTRLTLADIHVFSALRDQEYIKLYEKDYCNLTRWYKHVQSLPVVNNVISMIAKNYSPSLKPNNKNLQGEKSVGKQTKTMKQEGKFIDLPGAEMGKVNSRSTMRSNIIFKFL